MRWYECYNYPISFFGKGEGGNENILWMGLFIRHDMLFCEMQWEWKIDYCLVLAISRKSFRHASIISLSEYFHYILHVDLLIKNVHFTTVIMILFISHKRIIFWKKGMYFHVFFIAHNSFVCLLFRTCPIIDSQRNHNQVSNL